MPSVCLYFHVHQPMRIKPYSIFDIGGGTVFDDAQNARIIKKVAEKCYYPANNLIYELIQRYEGGFKVSYSISGVFLEQALKYEPGLIDSFYRLVKTGCVELVSETFYHSLASLYSEEELFEQVLDHMLLVARLFGQVPNVFRNTELVYFDYLPQLIERFHFKAVLAEGWDGILGWRSPNFVYKAKGSDIKLLLKNYRLSDDIAFRFSNKGWDSWPLTADKFARWVHALNGNGEVINLFMDYETLGEHQWHDTGIFEFLRYLPEAILKHPDMDFVTVSEEADRYKAVAELSMPQPVSWADTERDLSAWLGNEMQQSTIRALYDLEEAVKATHDIDLIRAWRLLQTSDHFYYMCTKWFTDGDVHKYFNAYERPHDAYIYFANALVDFTERVSDSLELSQALRKRAEAPRIVFETTLDDISTPVPDIGLPGIGLPVPEIETPNMVQQPGRVSRPAN